MRWTSTKADQSLGQAGCLLAEDGEQALGAAATTGLMATLLPDWEEYWLMVERERVRQALMAQVRSPAGTDGGSR
ncbi:MAG: hypothetical protein ACJ72N_04655 [Labedaea sp.]